MARLCSLGAVVARGPQKALNLLQLRLGILRSSNRLAMPRLNCPELLTSSQQLVLQAAAAVCAPRLPLTLRLRLLLLCQRHGLAAAPKLLLCSSQISPQLCSPLRGPGHFFCELLHPCDGALQRCLHHPTRGCC